MPKEPAVIFDMDGLLLDTEPLWGEAMLEVAAHYQIPIRLADFRATTGLRIYEVTAYWAEKFPWPGEASSEQIADDILDAIIYKSKTHGRIMPGALQLLDWLHEEEITRGLATSSPMRMVTELIAHFQLEDRFQALLSADTALMGKPHPEVYLQCAHALNVAPWNCLALEDSVNGMVAAKAARMKVVVVPEAQKFNHPGFGLADGKLASLEYLTPKYLREIWA